MTVQDIINELKKMPNNLEVYMADHDHGHYETSSKAYLIELIDKKKMTQYEKDDLDPCFKYTPQRYIVIRSR